jgi:TatD DNase family protein
LVLETDAPFLTPVPFRGQICEPKHVAATAEFLARLKDESLDELSKITTDNALRLFSLK